MNLAEAYKSRTDVPRAVKTGLYDEYISSVMGMANGPELIEQLYRRIESAKDGEVIHVPGNVSGVGVVDEQYLFTWVEAEKWLYWVGVGVGVIIALGSIVNKVIR